jgi:hypothetical protein
VSQTYHLYNDMAGFLLVWALLSLPLVYLLKSGAAFTGCLACVAARMIVISEGRGETGLLQAVFWLAAIMPFYARLAWKRRDSLTVMWLSYALAIALPIMAVPFYRGVHFTGVLVCHGLMFTVYYLVSCRWFGGLRGFRAPFRSIGSLGLAVVAVSLTFNYYRYGTRTYWTDDYWGHNGLTVCLVCAVALALGGFMLWRKISFNWGAACFPLFILFTLAPVVPPEDNWTPLIMNTYVLALGVFTLVRGARGDSLFSMNEGMILISALIACRFFDSDYGFVARGVAFIVIGCGFLAANLVTLEKRRRRRTGI